MNTFAWSIPKIQAAIEDVLSHKSDQLVAAYYNPDGPFAGALFDEYGDNPEAKFTSDDFVAASLLDVRFDSRAVRILLEQRSADYLLAEIPHTPLWEDVDLSRTSNAARLWSVLLDIPGIGGTRASKLMARKRPSLFPILDSIVRYRLGLGHEDAWSVLREVLADEGLRDRIDELSDSADATRPPSTLRLLDVATWMRFSRSANAVEVRESLNIQVAGH